MRLRNATISPLISGFLFLCATLACGRDDEAVLKSRVLKEFPAALRALEEHFSRAVGSVNYSLERGIGKAKSRHRGMAGKFTFATRRPYWARVVSSRPKPLKSSGPRAAGKEVPEAADSSDGEFVYCYNKLYSFSLSKKNADSQYVITSFDKNVDGEPPRSLKVQVDGWLFEYLDAPFSFSAAYQPLSRIISSDSFSIQRVSEVRQDGEIYLKLEVRLKEGIWKIAKGKPSPDYDGWILVAPEKKWVVREYELGHGAGGLRGRVEYGDIQDSFPVPKRIVVEGFDRSSKELHYVHDFTFEDLRFVDPPDDEFTLAAFGLPEIGKPETPRSRYANRTAFWLLGASLASLFVAIVLKYYSSTHRLAPPESAPGSIESRLAGPATNPPGDDL